MLRNIALFLTFIWLLALITGNTMGGLIHVLLITAVGIMLIRQFNRPRIVNTGYKLIT